MYWLSKLFTDGRTHLRAAAEVSILFLFSLIPFVLTVLTRMRIHPNAGLETADLISRGQLFLLAYALCGPIIWLAFVRWDKPKHGARTTLGVIALFIMFPVVALIGVDPTFSAQLDERLISISLWTYALLLACRYLLTFYVNIEPPTVKEVLTRESKSMREQYEDFEDGK